MSPVRQDFPSLLGQEILKVIRSHGDVLLLSYLVIYKVLESVLVSAMGSLIGGLGNSLNGLFK